MYYVTLGYNSCLYYLELHALLAKYVDIGVVSLLSLVFKGLTDYL
jgi:hypothetical protein